MPLDIERLEKLEEEATNRLDPASDDYESMVSSLSRISNLIDNHYKGQRQVDDTGKLTADATTRQPARVGTGDASYFFEPNVSEVQSFFKRNPDALDRLRDSKGSPLRSWTEGESVPEIRSPMFDAQTQALTGYNVTPKKTHLDTLREDEEPYKVAAEEMWRLASEDAASKGGSVKRYRDIKLDANEWKDYIEGGVKKGLSRIVAPATLGAADAMSSGQASPLYDAMGDLADYRQARMSPEEKENARAMGYDPEDSEDMASSEDIHNRSKAAYVGGNIAGYALPGNPANAIAGAATKALGYGSRGVLGRAGAAALAGGISSAEESAVGDMARYANEGGPIPVGDVALHALGAGAIGVAGGGLFDFAGQGIGAGREGFRRFERNAPLRTLEEAGGRADAVTGVAAPTEIQQAFNQMHAVNPNGPPVTAGGQLAADLAPELQKSVNKRSVDEQMRTEAEMEEYYNHPDYQDIRVSARPAVEGMVEMAQRGMGRNSSTGASVPMDPAVIDQIGGILRDYSEATAVTRAEGPGLAHASGGTLVNGELANRLYGYKEGDIGYFAPGQDAVVHPIDVNAQNLTTLEQRIDRELNFAAARGNNNDPVWNRFNERVKSMRDEFPAYKDAEGKLVAPPPDSVRNEPFDLAGDLPRPETEGKYIPPPRAVGGGTPQKPEGLMGVGPGQPDLPSSPFDPRAGITPGVAADQLPRPVGVGGEGMVARPEGLYGVGPGGPPIPENPFDTRLGTSQEVVRPMAQRNISGGEYGPPPPLDPNARMGIGPRDNQGPVQSFTAEGLPVPDAKVAPQPTQSVQGDYNKPPEVERAPITERSPYGFAGMLSREEPSPEVFQREYGHTQRIEPRKSQDISPEERAIQQHEIDEFLRKDQAANAPDERSALERSLDERLDAPDAPPVPKTEIEEAGARQTADREQVARDQKAYVEDLFAPGREARAAQIEQVRSLGENPEVIEEAIAAVKKVDERLGPIPQEQKRKMVIDMIERKLGRKIDAEDLIRFGLISAGLVQMSTSDDDTGAAVGAGILSFGLGRGKKGSEPEAPKEPSKPTKPTQPEATLDDGRVVRGFSAMRNQQHTRQEAIEKGMKRLGVEGDNTLESRIRTYGQGNDRQKIDRALLEEATAIGKEGELRRAAGANAYPGLRDRSWPAGSSRSVGNAIVDIFLVRGHRVGEYLSGRFNREFERNPFIRGNDTTSGEIQQALLQEPARRLLNLTQGGPASRLGGEAIYDKLFKNDSVYESVEDEKKRNRKEKHP